MNRILIKFVYIQKIHMKQKTKCIRFYWISVFIEYSNDMDCIYKNIEEYNRKKKRKILIVFDDIIANMLSNKKLNPVVTKLFIRGGELNISLVFITKQNNVAPKILDWIQHTQTNKSFNKLYSSYINSQDFMNFYKKCTAKPDSFLVIDTTLAPDNSSCTRKNLLETL